jgi:DNA-directed RNA polymerase specialized sigma24 family protein
MSRRLDPAFLALVAAHEEALLRAARLLTGDWEQAEGLLRDTLAWALAGWEMLLDDEVAALRIQQRLIANFLSSQSAAGEPEPAGSAESTADRPALVTALAGLPAEDRAVVVSRYYLELSAPEIGEILGVEAESVSAIAARALAALRWGQ